MSVGKSPTALQKVASEHYRVIQRVVASHFKESEGSTPSGADLMNQLKQKPWAPSSESTLRNLKTIRH